MPAQSNNTDKSPAAASNSLLGTVFAFFSRSPPASKKTVSPLRAAYEANDIEAALQILTDHGKKPAYHKREPSNEEYTVSRLAAERAFPIDRTQKPDVDQNVAVDEGAFLWAVLFIYFGGYNIHHRFHKTQACQRLERCEEETQHFLLMQHLNSVDIRALKNGQSVAGGPFIASESALVFAFKGLRRLLYWVNEDLKPSASDEKLLAQWAAHRAFYYREGIRVLEELEPILHFLWLGHSQSPSEEDLDPRQRKPTDYERACQYRYWACLKGLYQVLGNNEGIARCEAAQFDIVCKQHDIEDVVRRLKVLPPPDAGVFHRVVLTRAYGPALEKEKHPWDQVMASRNDGRLLALLLVYFGASFKETNLGLSAEEIRACRADLRTFSALCQDFQEAKAALARSSTVSPEPLAEHVLALAFKGTRQLLDFVNELCPEAEADRTRWNKHQRFYSQEATVLLASLEPMLVYLDKGKLLPEEHSFLTVPLEMKHFPNGRRGYWQYLLALYNAEIELTDPGADTADLCAKRDRCRAALASPDALLIEQDARDEQTHALHCNAAALLGGDPTEHAPRRTTELKC